MKQSKVTDPAPPAVRGPRYRHFTKTPRSVAVRLGDLNIPEEARTAHFDTNALVELPCEEILRGPVPKISYGRLSRLADRALNDSLPAETVVILPAKKVALAFRLVHERELLPDPPLPVVTKIDEKPADAKPSPADSAPAPPPAPERKPADSLPKKAEVPALPAQKKPPAPEPGPAAGPEPAPIRHETLAAIAAIAALETEGRQAVVKDIKPLPVSNPDKVGTTAPDAPQPASGDPPPARPDRRGLFGFFFRRKSDVVPAAVPAAASDKPASDAAPLTPPPLPPPPSASRTRVEIPKPKKPLPGTALPVAESPIPSKERPAFPPKPEERKREPLRPKEIVETRVDPPAADPQESPAGPQASVPTVDLPPPVSKAPPAPAAPLQPPKSTLPPATFVETEHLPAKGVEPPAEIPNQDPLQALFMTEEILSPGRVMELCGGLPGINSCILTRAGGVVSSHNVPESLDLVSLSAHALEMISAMRTSSARMGVGAVPAVTIHADKGPITFFHQDDVCLLVLHKDRGFIPGVREKLQQVTVELAHANLPRPAARTARLEN